jgi:hypothetical protein
MIPMQSDKPITITLEAQHWNVVLSGLQEMPYRIAVPVIRALSGQFLAVTDAPAQTEHANGEDRAAAA